jgi:hypothetical protein
MNIGGEILHKYDPASRPPRRDPPPTFVSRVVAWLILLAGSVLLSALVGKGLESKAVASEVILGCAVFACSVVAYRFVAWIAGPDVASMHDEPEDFLMDVLFRPRRWTWGIDWWLVRRQWISVRIRDREKVTTFIGVTPMQRTLTRLAGVALVAALILWRHT